MRRKHFADRGKRMYDVKQGNKPLTQMGQGSRIWMRRGETEVM